MILLRLDKKSIGNENDMKFEIKYHNEIEDRNESVEIDYSFKKEMVERPNYFSDRKIETALSLFYFGKFNRRFMKICNNENKKKKYKIDYIKRPEFIKEKENIKKFLKEHLNGEKTDNPNEEMEKEYLDNMERNAEKAVKYCGEKKDEEEKVVYIGMNRKVIK